MTVLAKFVLERGELRRAVDVVPVGVVLLDVDDRIRLTEPVDFERRLILSGLLRPDGQYRGKCQDPRERDRSTDGLLLSGTHHRVLSLTLACSHALTLRLASSNRRS